jgi:hypothetical protein
LNDFDHQLIPAELKQQRVDGETFRFERADPFMAGQQFAVEPDLAAIIASVNE